MFVCKVNRLRWEENGDEEIFSSSFNPCNAAAYGVFYGYSCRCGGSDCRAVLRFGLV